MSITFKAVLGVHPQALKVSADRSGVLASNLSNADTPGYKAQDIDFSQELQRQLGMNQSLPMAQTQSGHLLSQSQSTSENFQYRVPLHSSLDGNTVDAEMERIRFTENALRYEASLQFLSKKFSGLKGALRGD